MFYALPCSTKKPNVLKSVEKWQELQGVALKISLRWQKLSELWKLRENLETRQKIAKFTRGLTFLFKTSDIIFCGVLISWDSEFWDIICKS